MTSERRNSGITGDGRRRAPSRASSTAAQSAKRGTNRKVLKAVSWTARLGSWVVSLGSPVRALVDPVRGRVLRVGSVRGRTLRVVATIGVVAVIAIGVEVGWRAVTTSPTFAIDSIEVVGAQRASEDEIRALMAVELGDNAIALDTSELGCLAEKHPWVSSARVLRRLPRGLTIEVEEHAPVALVALEHLYYVDADGEVVKRLAHGEREVLPVITGLSREDVEHSDALALSQIRAALAFIGVWSRGHPNGAVALDEVHVGPAGEISIGLADAALRVHLGPAPWDEAIARADDVREEARQRGFVPAEIAAWSERHPDRAVVRIAAITQEASALADPTSAPPGKGASRSPAKPIGGAGAQ